MASRKRGKEIDPQVRMPHDNLFIFVTDSNAHMGILKGQTFVSMTEKGKEYPKEEVKYWIENKK